MGNIDRLLQSKLELSNLLDGFEPSFNADSAISDHVLALAINAPSFFVDAYLLDENLSDARKLLDRLIELRRAIWDSETVRVQAGLGYISALEQAEAEARVELTKATTVSAEFRKAVENRQAAVKRAIESLEQQHAAPGSALNFKERLAKLLAVLYTDIESCYVRSIAVEQGCRLFYDDPILSRPMPGNLKYVAFEGAQYLDDWVVWIRRLARSIEARQGREAEHELTISLGSPAIFETEVWSEVSQKNPELANHSAMKTLIPGFMDLVRGNKTIEFSLDDIPGIDRPYTVPPERFRPIPRRFVRPRLKAIGLYASIKSPASPKTGWSFAVDLSAFETPMIAMVANSSYEEIRWYDGGAIRNRLVRGLWRLRVTGAAAPAAEGQQFAADRAQWPLTDLKLCLKFISGAS